MMTFNLWTDARQISAAPNSHQYLILLLENDKFLNGLRFLVQNRGFFLPRLHSPAKATQYSNEILSFQDSVIRATQ